jgi:hypothetical protein
VDAGFAHLLNIAVRCTVFEVQFLGFSLGFSLGKVLTISLIQLAVQRLVALSVFTAQEKKSKNMK